jgi:hypothetical protein
MSDVNAAPAGESLSVEQATGLMTGAIEQPAPEEREDDEEIPAEPTADDPEPIEAAAEEAEPEPELPAIDPPHSWDADAKADFAQLPRELQEKVVQRETQREKAVSEAQQRAAEAVKRAEAEASTLGQYKTALDQLIPQAQQTFANRWQGVDFAKWAEEDPIAAFQGKEQFDAEMREMQRLHAAQQFAQREQYAKFLEAEGAKLPELAPDLADPEKGPARKEELKGFLVSAGIPETDLAYVSAAQLAIAYDAMRFRQLQAKARDAVKPPPARPALRPSPAPERPSHQRSVEQINGRLNRSGSVDDAVALLRARRKTG